MSRIVFRKLIISSPVEEAAKYIEFDQGLNIVTSDRETGNDRGKSVILKSLYHTLGADCKFDSKFDASHKIFILTFSFNEDVYSMYRSGIQFKLFDAGLNLIWDVSNRHELAEKLYDMFDFAIWLPNRDTGITEIAPPAYSFAPYYVDQNQYHGSEFRSFERLGEYKGYRGDLIYIFTGALDKTYFDIKGERDALKITFEQCDSEIKTNAAMRKQISDELSSLGYSEDMPALRHDCDEYESDFKAASEKLARIRQKLFELRAKRADTELALKGFEAFQRNLGRQIEKLSSGVCPICSRALVDSVAVRVHECVTFEDALILGDELKIELDKTNRTINAEEQRYRVALSELKSITSVIKCSREADLTATQIEGLVHLEKRLGERSAELNVKLLELQDRIDEIKKRLNEYAARKKKIDSRFVDLIRDKVFALNLQSVDLDRVVNARSSISASGSNSPLATLAWYFTLLELKNEYNNCLVEMPVVLDSPLNVEADDEKYNRQYELIFNVLSYKGQMIVSGLGLEEADVVPNDAKIIELKNEKYQILNAKDYSITKEVLFRCMQQH